ncbi:2-dehydropantoate 2-reductase [Anaeromyxobacter diazotrophicus]|uniref:2-dehydropantoate 2-reductase n=1 Tax=Anaeromyxobacter diazotrophicus TaxID=2590199 RepID=A0A7I9VSA7_9BACT|nr:2-dehydropantoate 2-reductase [Anaeromyxobacter diazotrophicus]GEJ59336.1 2-dehydropantoate 2-reductase [Anaeromyxobacter diazotrophicus]
MKICVVGAGAIGGLVAVKLARAGEQVSVVARGAHLAAIRERGLTLLEGGREEVARVAATDRLAELGPQDLVVLAMKAHQLAPVAAELPALCGPETVLLTAQNGIPWWYFAKYAGPLQGARLESVDPGGVIAAHLDVERVLGSIIYPAAEIAAPGVVRHVEGNRITVGELDGRETPRLGRVAEALRAAGFKTRVTGDLRSEIWVKLWGNCTFNPLSALTHATLAGIIRFPATRALATGMMREAQAVGEKLGARFGVSLEKRIAGAEGVGEHKTSMLQDVESGRALEVDALLGAVLELARLTETPAPHLAAVHACVSLLSHTLQEQGARLRVEKLGR